MQKEFSQLPKPIVGLIVGGANKRMPLGTKQVKELVQLIEEAVFQSNYNQMFLLGRYEKDLFEESYNAFPISRLYRIKF